MPSELSMKSTSRFTCSVLARGVARTNSSPNTSSHHGRRWRFLAVGSDLLLAGGLVDLRRGGGGGFA
jgi:hypothetical protein